MTAGARSWKHRLGDLLRAQHRAGWIVTLATGTRASWSQTQRSPPARREPVAEHLRQRHDAFALRGRDEA